VFSGRPKGAGEHLFGNGRFAQPTGRRGNRHGRPENVSPIPDRRMTEAHSTHGHSVHAVWPAGQAERESRQVGGTRRTIDPRAGPRPIRRGPTPRSIGPPGRQASGRSEGARRCRCRRPKTKSKSKRKTPRLAARLRRLRQEREKAASGRGQGQDPRARARRADLPPGAEPTGADPGPQGPGARSWTWPKRELIHGRGPRRKGRTLTEAIQSSRGLRMLVMSVMLTGLMRMLLVQLADGRIVAPVSEQLRWRFPTSGAMRVGRASCCNVSEDDL